FEAIDPSKLVYQKVSGTLLTADTEADQKIEELLYAKQDDKSFVVKWEHAADKRTHRYRIDSVARKATASALIISWDGKPLNLDIKGEHKVEIPAIGDFKVMNVKVVNDGSQYISVFFSDPILGNQDLNGLISFDKPNTNATTDIIDLKFTIEGHEIKCYPGITLSGTHRLNVSQGIQNILGYKLKQSDVFDLDFADLLPAIKFLGKGVIMPASNKLMLPFESVGLNAVDVTIIKIYENNIAQFFQVNDFNGSSQLVRVGRPLIKKTIRLDTDKLMDLRRSNHFAIDLDHIIKTEPGAIYQVKITFKKAYSLYRCNGASQTEPAQEEGMQAVEEENWDGENQKDQSYWDMFGGDEYDVDYNWNQRDNPCQNSYYNQSRWVTRNIMASNLGIIAKKGTHNEYLFAVTHLISTQTISGVSIELLDYQQQLIGTTSTNGEGIAKIKVDRKPFLVIAKYKEQRAYLKLDDGSSLTLSQFDVSGDVVQKGLKGFLYGERGVWRPGDSLYLTFILEDRNQTLPEMHPVSLELFDPNGALYKRHIQSTSVNGFYNFRTCTDANAITGNWQAKVKVGGITFQKNIKIETVMPNRLKIELNFDKPYLEKGDAISTTLKSRWLHGAIADGLSAKVEATLTPSKTIFKRYAEFTFDDPTKRFQSESKTVFEDNLDQNGEAKLNLDLSFENSPAGMLNANFITKVFEPGGSFSVDRFSIPFHPYSEYLGLRLPKGDQARGMLLTDTNHNVQIVCVNPNGSPVKGTKTVTAHLYKVNWRWWWDKSEADLSSYATNNEYRILDTKEIQLINGVGKYTLRINYPEWGRYLLKISDGDEAHSTGKVFYMDWPGWAGRASRDNPAEAAMLTFSLNKSVYQVGEQATLTIPTPKAGRALLSIESGSEVLETHWIEAKEGQTHYTFKITKSMLPNVYAHITLVQPHAQILNDLPIRMYGMMYLKVEDPATKLLPVITMANQIRPDIEANISVREATGKAMTYTLAIVDEGLLDLTRFKTPDPHASFYAREALGVKTWDLFDYVMGALGTQFNRILSIGGDEGINRKGDAKKAKRFVPVVKFMGPFHLPAGKSAQHSFTITNYVGSVRVMVVAGYKGAYGFAEKAVPVKKPLMVLATLPRVLRPGETMKLPVNIFAMENYVKKVNVQVIGNNLVQVMGASNKIITFNRPGDEVIDFDLKVKNNLGIAKVKIIASSGTEKAEYEVELDVRNPNPYASNVYEGSVEAGKTWAIKYSPVGMAGTNTTALEVSTIPPINLENRLRYLIQYPHGCVEQTTSAVFPQLALNKLLNLNEGWKREIEINVKAGIQKLRQFQNPEGGLGYWPGEHYADDWATSYAGHFMVEAQNEGYSLPLNFLANWKKYQRNKALSWTQSSHYNDDQTQAYRLYTLALAKAPELGAMNRLKESKTLSYAARWRLAATYIIAGNKEVANNLVKAEKITVTTQPANENYYSYTYGSNERDEAMMMETLVLMGEKEKASVLLKSLCQKLSSQMWMSTQTTAYSLLAIASLTGKFQGDKVLEFDYTYDGKTTHYRANAHLANIPFKVIGTRGSKVLVSNVSGQLLFTRLITRGQPEMGEQTPAQNNLSIEVVYKTMKDLPLNPNAIEQGTDFKAEVTISNPGMRGNYEQLALTQVFPSGWEIHNSRMDGNATDSKYQVPRYQDIRDDRVYSYFNLGAKTKVTFVILLNASYIGRFYLPGFSCEAMYRGEISARMGSTWVEVVPKVIKGGLGAK
ncbi:MAG: MG2 domain-containing protein, partial [Bacteroidota bacterium]|nr:MG2 domain-containing protein [Bacteroidota bacterium]